MATPEPTGSGPVQAQEARIERAANGFIVHRHAGIGTAQTVSVFEDYEGLFQHLMGTFGTDIPRDKVKDAATQESKMKAAMG